MKARTDAKSGAAAKPKAKRASKAKGKVEQATNTRLLGGLVPEAASKKNKKGKVSFIDAMSSMGITSVFDIIREPKSVFVERLGKLCDADGALAYKNAQCFAVQIGSLYREHRVSSGNASLSQTNGVRALVEIGPSYTNEFKEKWGEFCKEGALPAMDGPVAYLRSIYRLATETLEKSGKGTKDKILLKTRRPDLPGLLIDQHATFTPRPMLALVNDILQALITQYLQGTPDAGRPINEVLAERKHPFIFPYNFAHHQCMLGLSDKKPHLGEINYRISLQLPINERAENDYGAVQNIALEAQRLMSGLSPQQQRLLIESSLFTTFYLTKASLQAGWQGPGTVYLSPHKRHDIGYLVLPGQPAIKRVDPSAEALANTQPNQKNETEVEFSKANDTLTSTVTLSSSTPTSINRWRLNHLHTASEFTICPHIIGPPTLPPNSSGYCATFNMTVATGAIGAPVYLSTLSFTLTLDEFFEQSSEQRDFFRHYLGVHSSESLVSLNTFMQQTELTATQVEALLSQRNHYPRLSANCLSTNLQVAKGGISGHYGSCYVNGHGSDRYDTLPTDTASIIKDKYDNAMGLKEVEEPNGVAWYLTKTSLNRFDRMQRMIRLQRWMGIPFAELDTLVVSAMRSEGVDNLTLDLNVNTLRVLGVYRYLSRRYKLTPEEFAAFLHHLSPYATGDRMPLLDQVFNNPVVFDQPLILDQKAFTYINPNEASRRTLFQLCAGLGVQPTQTSLLHLLEQTKKYGGDLTRSLETISSLYRQARIAQLFDWSVEDASAAIKLLGGETYQRNVCTGKLTNCSSMTLQKPADPPKRDLGTREPGSVDAAATVPDILDILMHLDWLATYLKDSRQTITQVRQLLGLAPGDYLPAQDTVERIARLALDTRAQLVTDQEIQALNLPTHQQARNSRAAGKVIDWRAILEPLLLDKIGLVYSLPLELREDTQQQLKNALTAALAPLELDPQTEDQSKEKLGALLLAAHDRQLRLIEGLSQEWVDLPMDRAQIVVRWSGTTVYELLVAVMSSAQHGWLVERLQILLRHAQAALHLNLSTAAMRLFLVRPECLGAVHGANLSLSSFYLLERYSHWFNSQRQAEESLLGYFLIANPVAAQIKTKAQRQRVNDASNEAIANLLGWDEQEVGLLCQQLPEGRASSMDNVVWLQRCQQTCVDTGLSAADLLAASGLHVGSASETWKSVGEAVVAASR